uniref:NB-ARC domain-containing protein n=1 Tax=Oryza rufipogon TaxID=4529 RepID=A0A0E0Q3F1_ORYRU
MEIFLSAILGDLASRSISFLINKCSKPTVLTVEEKLQRLLLQACFIVEESDERLIINQAMLQQLNILRKEMYRGYYTLDSFRCHGHQEYNPKDLEVSSSFAPSMFNPAKRVRFCRVTGQSVQEHLLQQVFGRLEVTIEDMSEFVMFLNSYPRFCRQPYSMHLLLDKCLFSRQMEMENIMNFLLKEDTTGTENPGVLPIIGPGKVGKSTLIEHACDDERVRNHFSQIVLFNDDDLEDANILTLRDSGVIKHQNHATGGKRILIIIELTRDINEGAWRRLYSASKSHVASGSKIIVASRSEKIASFGTTQALRVKFFTQEAYWYFFKVRTFGSINAVEHPKLASVAMDIARELNGCFMGASIYSGLLKANINFQFWRRALAIIREFKKLNLLLYGAYFFDDPWQAVEPSYIRTVNKINSEYLLVLDDYQICSAPNMIHCHKNSAHSEDEVPMVNVKDFLFGNVKPQGKFKVLAWRSHLPPHYSYVFNCEVKRISGHSLQEQLQQVVGSIEVTLEDMSVFVMFLNSCPHLCRQPYSMHLLLDKCLFGRQMEIERIMNFLLKVDSPGSENPGVLPIIGRRKAGKSTLIEHACNDERVRNHFSQIVCFSDDDLKDADMVTLRHCGSIKNGNQCTGGERILIVIELIRDIDEVVWTRLYSASKSYVPNGSKIIVASQSDKIARFGTTQALRVELFTEEAYWYFFKVRTFGSMDAQEHPKMASMAMEMARELQGCFMGASIYSGLLKANFNARFWNMALASIREYKQTNLLVYGTYFENPWQASEPPYVRTVNKISSEYLVIHDEYHTCSVQNMVLCRTNFTRSEAEVPMLSMQDFLFGSVRPQGKFKVLAWKSHLPPYYNHMFNCEVNMLRQDMHKGYYALDTFRIQKHQEEDMNDDDDNETFLSAILGDLASRSISFLINKSSKPTALTVEERLQRLLLRARIILEEADERLITNQSMLQQLNILRKEMYRGYYTLDRFRCHVHEADHTKDHEVSNHVIPSKFNPAKRIRFCRVSGKSLEEQLQQVFGSLEVTIEDMGEVVMFLNSCPRLCRQPYSMHLLLDNAENLGVLPIIGPGKVGKSTLIEHACEDERVRNRFSQIVCFNDDDVGHANMVALRDCGVIKHKNHSIGGDRMLIIIELMGDIDEGVWGRLYSASKISVAVGSKIIVTSRSDKIVSFGTTQVLRVNFFTQEAYWYFFKVRTFGSLDAEEHPKLASLAMDIAREMNQCFMGSCIYSVLLKANFNARFWSMALARIREFKLKNNLIYNAYLVGGPWEAVKPAYVRTVNKISSEYLVVLHDYQTLSVPNMVHCYTNSAQSEGEVPEVSMQDFLFGSVKPQGKFKVLAWRSHLPPHYNYIFNCEPEGGLPGGGWMRGWWRGGRCGGAARPTARLCRLVTVKV